MEEEKQEARRLRIPGAGEAYGISWSILRKNFLELLLVMVLLGVLSMPGAYYGNQSQQLQFDFVSYLFSLMYMFLVYLPVNYGVAYAYLKAVRGEKVKATDIFKSFDNFWNVVLGNLLTGAIVAFGIMLLIFPGLYFLARLSFVPYYLVDKKMEAIDAIKASWENTKGYTTRILSILFLAIPVGILGLLCLGVGVIVSIMLIMTTLAYFYYTVDSNQNVNKNLGMENNG